MNPFEQQVRERAYYIWEGEGRVFGRADEHWLMAEAELRPVTVSAPVYVQNPAADLSLAPSPAKVLKPRASRSAGAAAKAVSETSVAAKSETAPRQAKAAATKSTATKTASAKAAAAPKATKAAASKTVSSNGASTKPRAMSKPRAAAMESAATVH
ncbi:DUF2934 domain-containing protein [Methylobacterium marchantiae]|uniref:DUF2934 domain-containing protein n=1 Tax=Methylobacterium marchantiae TaxID=600331 RepID=A0ABW3X2V4_9HYPH|nr:hypothetical protein AIGOOFII_3625 [Methylobacterium marchantiae]